MTGHRLKKGKPLRAVGTAQRSRAHAERRLQLAGTPAQRVAAAADRLRAVLERAPHPLAADTADEIQAALMAAADRVDAAVVAAAQRRKEAS